MAWKICLLFLDVRRPVGAVAVVIIALALAGGRAGAQQSVAAPVAGTSVARSPTPSAGASAPSAVSGSPAAPAAGPRPTRYVPRALPGSGGAAAPVVDLAKPIGFASAQARFNPDAVVAARPAAASSEKRGASASSVSGAVVPPVRGTGGTGGTGAAAAAAAAAVPVAPARVLGVWRQGTFPSTVRPGAVGERPRPAGGGRAVGRPVAPPAEGEVRILSEAEMRVLSRPEPR